MNLDKTTGIVLKRHKVRASIVYIESSELQQHRAELESWHWNRVGSPIKTWFLDLFGLDPAPALPQNITYKKVGERML